MRVELVFNKNFVCILNSKNVPAALYGLINKTVHIPETPFRHISDMIEDC